MVVVDKIQAAEEQQRIGYSFEYFPPKTDMGLANLYDRMERMADLKPGFVSCTWGAGGSTHERSLELCKTAQNVYGLETLMHLTCTNMAKDQVDLALQEAKEAGIRNILALRGDPPRGHEYWTPCDGGFCHAIDLVQYIRKEHGDYFCIGVAGYPEGHIDTPNKEDDLKYLQEKVDAGADFILTQVFYNVDTFVAWKTKCRDRGIQVPIVPGIIPITTYQSFRRMVNLCKVSVPPAILEALDEIKADDQRVKEYGVELAVSMMKRLEKEACYYFHISTLNLERSTRLILQALDLVQHRATSTEPANAKCLDVLAAAKTVGKKSTLGQGRAESWDEFPNGRYGDSRSPAFGQNAYGSIQLLQPSKASHQWGTPKQEEDISQLFVDYIRGRQSSLPWCEEELQTETDAIRERLEDINRRGYWTIGSQPAVNGAPSQDKVHGWGPTGGYVYQKAFLEFFVTEAKLAALITRLKSDASITYCATNHKGEYRTNVSEKDAQNAVTWGVFPGKEIVQPTLIDRDNFMAYKDEAYELWTEWEQQHAPESDTAKLLQKVQTAVWLVNVVHNDFQQPDVLFDIMLA